MVKNGLPVPAAKITIRPFSRWRIARRRMYGSATSEIVIADCTRVGISCLLERVLQRQPVQHGREHAHVVAGRSVHALGRGRQAAVDVAAANDDRDLDAAAVNGRDLLRDRLTRSGSVPYSSSPISASPESFSSTRP